MTDATTSLRGLPEKNADVDRLRARIGFSAERLMEPEVGGPSMSGHRVRHRRLGPHPICTSLADR
ncbi:hypothetical protein HNR00_001723 [Methylorubrum rhodinum]|uniref:Uncharacterized protein n=1 Tax=Methylorubrum rhodinum TaxID=29428 RepID=A0A840ZIS6_9HYPH|nr:hypothetical protein [Methylorubrum rhodinum]